MKMVNTNLKFIGSQTLQDPQKHGYLARVAGGISRAGAFVLVAKPLTRVARPWEDSIAGPRRNMAAPPLTRSQIPPATPARIFCFVLSSSRLTSGGMRTGFLIWKGNTAKNKETFCRIEHTRMKNFLIEHITSHSWKTEKRTAMLLQRINTCPDLNNQAFRPGNDHTLFRNYKK